MPKSHRTLAQIENDLLSENPEVRGSAMQDLLLQARRDPNLHAAALALFQRAVKIENDPWTATSAARGIEHILGPQQARATWLALLNRPAVNMVTRIALAIDDPWFVPSLLDLLQRRPETPIRAAAMRTLGRLKDPAALGAIVDHLSTPELRADAIEALGDLGDPRAIPHLEPLLDDTTEFGREDERGAILQVSDLAAAAIRRLRAPAPR